MKKINLLVIALTLSLVAIGVSAETASTTPKVKKGEGTQMTRLLEKGDKAIAARVEALNKLIEKITSMKLVSAENKASLNTQIQNQITALNNLKAKIATDTELATLKDDVRSITVNFRIYALIIPQGRIIAAADRLNMLAGDFAVIATKLQTRINEAQTAGKDVTKLNTLLTELNAKITDAKTQAQTAISHSVSLAPDNGDKTVMTSNAEALKQAHKDLQAGQQDIVAARKIIENIRKALKVLKLPVSSTTPATTTPTN